MSLDDTTAAESLGDEDGDEPGRPPSLWWAVHRIETYALAAFAIAAVTLVSTQLEQEVVQAFLFGRSNIDLRVAYGVPAAIRGGLAVFAAILAWVSIRSEDEDTVWSAPVARAAIVLAAIAVAFAVATVIGVLVSDTPQLSGFNSP